MQPIIDCSQLFPGNQRLGLLAMDRTVKYFDLRVKGPLALPGPNDHFRPAVTFGPPSDAWVVCDWHEENPEAWRWRLVTLENVTGIPEGHLPPMDMVMAPAKRKKGVDIVVNYRGQEMHIPNVHFFGRVWPRK